MFYLRNRARAWPASVWEFRILLRKKKKKYYKAILSQNYCRRVQVTPKTSQKSRRI